LHDNGPIFLDILVIRLRGLDSTELRHLLKGDLEQIILMALRKGPAAAYATVEAIEFRQQSDITACAASN
jgi:hypothetical protein